MEAEKGNLPWELVIEIFARLPMKYLMRFRCVSKPCYSLITEPHFINKHFQQSTKITSKNQKGVILSPTMRRHGHLVSCSLSDLYHRPIEDAAKVVYPMKDKKKYIKFSDSINGLFCIELLSYAYGAESSVFLWNPSTSESKRLPNHTLERYDDVETYGMRHILGFDSLNNDYKVLKLVRYMEMEPYIEAYLYSLCSDSWRKIDESPCYKFSDYSNGTRRKYIKYTELPFSSYKYVNGAIHWFGVEKNAVDSSKIFSLHMSTERFDEILLPDCVVMQNPHNGLEINIAVLRGMLCVYRNCAEQSFVLWLMKKYGDHESWEKKFDIPYPMSMFSRMYSSFVPLYYYETGDILMEASTEKAKALVIYKGKKLGFSKVVVRGVTRIMVAYIFAESLISPTPTGIKCIQVDV